VATIREITTEWTMASGGGKLSVMYFLEGIAVTSQRDALSLFWTAIKASLDNTVAYAISTSGREIDDATGNLVSAWSDSRSKTGVGSGSTEQVADATQGLITWRSEDVVNNRFVKGRTFVPGLSIAALSNGNMGSSTISTFQTAANALIAAGAGLAIWARPLKDPITHVITRPGSIHTATTAAVPTELAVLRRRRG